MEAMLFVYFANILPQVSTVMSGMIFIGFVALVFWILLGGIALSDCYVDFDWKAYKKPIWIIGIPLVVLCTLKPLIPDRDTVYLMAGAYVGQQVLTSQVAKDTYEIIGLEVNKILKEKKEQLKSEIETTTKEVTQ